MKKKQGIIFSAGGAYEQPIVWKDDTGVGSIMEEEGVDATGVEAAVASIVAKAKKNLSINTSESAKLQKPPGKKRKMTKEIDDITTGIQSMSSSENSNATQGKDNSSSVTMKPL